MATASRPNHTLAKELKIKPERELYLPVRAEANGAADSRSEQSECRTRRSLCEWLPRLERAAQRVAQRRRRIGKVRVVKDVKDLGPELEIHRLGKPKSLGKGEVQLPEPRAGEIVSRQVAERARLRDRKGRRI